MSNKYDAIVIGAGLGGLSAALTLLNKNKKVLILERHNVPGGCASSFVRGRFEFEVSLHELCGIGTADQPGGVGRLLKSYGVDVDWVSVPECYRVISTYSDGSKCDKAFPAGREAFSQAVASESLSGAADMATFWRITDICSEGLHFVQQPGADTSELVKKYPEFLIYGSMSVLQAFKKMKMSQKTIDILSVYWSYLGVPLNKMNFILYSQMLNAYITEGAVIPRNTSHELSLKMEKRVRELGGDIYYGKEVTEIFFENDKVAGVKCGSELYRAQNVLADINPHTLYGKLVPAKYVTKRQKKLCNMREKSFGGYLYQVYIGLDKSAEELGIKDYSIMMPEKMDSVAEYKNTRVLKADNYQIAVCPNVVNPDASPKGTSILIITGMCSDEVFKIDERDYFRIKQQLAYDRIAKFQQLTGINIENNIEEIEVATPLTIARFINTPNGACYGYETKGVDSMMARFMSMKKDMDIPGLYQVSGASVRGDGFSSVIAAGNLMASMIS